MTGKGTMQTKIADLAMCSNKQLKTVILAMM